MCTKEKDVLLQSHFTNTTLISAASAEDSCWLTSRLMGCQFSLSAAQINRICYRNPTVMQYYWLQRTGINLFPLKSEYFHHEQTL